MGKVIKFPDRKRAVNRAKANNLAPEQELAKKVWEENKKKDKAKFTLPFFGLFKEAKSLITYVLIGLLMYLISQLL